MVWAYVMENGDGVEKHSNQPVFQLIQKMGLTDEQLVFDQDNNRTEFCKLLESMDVGDKLIIRSVEDLADETRDLVSVFQRLNKSDACTISQITALTGVSKTTLYRALKEQKVGSPEG